MKNTLKIDNENRQLIMDKTFAKKASNIRNEEYDILQRARADYPNYVVKTRTIKKNPGKESYRGLTYEYMRKYINYKEATEENRLAALAEMNNLLFISECHSKSKRYPFIKKWFLNKYTEVAKYGVLQLEESDISASDETKEIRETSKAIETITTTAFVHPFDTTIENANPVSAVADATAEHKTSSPISKSA